jgi:ferritin
MKKPETLSKEVVALLTPRISNEYEAFYHYTAATNWCKNVGYDKAAEFFAKEAQDELEHAKGLENYLVDWNVTPALPAIAKPTVEFSGLLEVIEKSYSLEYSLYEEYEDTSMKIFKTGDLCVFDFLQKYRTIQKDSVAEYSDKLNMLEVVDAKSKFEMLMLEKKLF